MNGMWFRNSVWQLALSVIVLGIFIILAIGSSDPSINEDFKKETGQSLSDFNPATVSQERFSDGETRITRDFKSGEQVTETGRVDKDGFFEGTVTTMHFRGNGKLLSIQKCNYSRGLRHGILTTEYFNTNREIIKTSTHCYKQGGIVSCDEKSTMIIEDQSAYEILIGNYPWYGVLLNLFEFDDAYIKSFMDTLETVIYASEVADTSNEDEFSDYYNDAVNDLEKTPFDSIIQRNNGFILLYGVDLIKHAEFRLITLDRYRSEDKDTYKTVKNKFSNYLLELKSLEETFTDEDFKGFCEQYDSLLVSYGPLDPNDDYFADSVDIRMLWAFSDLTSDDPDSTSTNENKSSIVLKSLEIEILPGKNLKLSSLSKFASAINKIALSQTPKDVAALVAATMFFEFLKADLILNATEEAYNLKKGIVVNPSVVTEYVSNNSSVSVTIAGDVLKDGGGDITSRGVVYGKGYNPNLDNEVMLSGSGNGIFEVNITGLTEGETYNARAFATNSAGTSYGNCISFKAGGTVGIQDIGANNFDLKIYPNPASEITTFSFYVEQAESIVLTIVNLKGQVIIETDLGQLPTGQNQVQLNHAKLQAGIYNCSLLNKAGKRSSQKLLIVH